MRRLSLSFVGLLAVSLAHAGEPFTGNFRLHLSEDAARTALLTGRPTPKARLALRPDGTFDLQTDGVARHGHYKGDGASIALVTDGGDTFHGTIKDGQVSLEGLAFERIETKDPVGVWTVRRNGLEDRSMRLEFKKDGTFGFKMSGATSEGTWSLVDGMIQLAWTKIDGDAVDAGTVHKAIPMDDEGVFVQIDTYRYERATDK